MADKNLLVIDKNDQIMSRFSRELERNGFRIHQADNDRQVLDIVENGGLTVDLCLAYLSINDKSPVSLANHLMEEFDVPTLFLSPNAEKDEVNDAVAAGGIGFLVEPLGITQVLPSVQVALQRAREISALVKERKNLQHAVRNGRDTNVSIGILMERNNLSRHEAFDLLRREARNRRIRLEELGKEVVKSTDSLNSLGSNEQKGARSDKKKRIEKPADDMSPTLPPGKT